MTYYFFKNANSWPENSKRSVSCDFYKSQPATKVLCYATVPMLGEGWRMQSNFGKLRRRRIFS
jgi:hypothetical protein